MAALLLAGVAGLAPSVGASSSPPQLPAISAQDLVAKVIAAQPAGLSGTVQTRTDLGLPSLGSLGAGHGDLLTTLLAPHTIRVWAAPGGKLHLVIPDPLVETDVVSDGTQVWVWRSASQTVIHLAKPAGQGDPDGEADTTQTPMPEPTPPALAAQLLSSVDPTTRVFVRGTATVAGRRAYELVLAPRSPDSLVADAVIDVDADTGVPLRVQVLPLNATSPGLDVGFTSIDLSEPAASNFAFTPPPGSTVTEATTPEELLFEHRRDPREGKRGPEAQTQPATDRKAQVLGTGWDAVLALSSTPGPIGELGTPVSGPWGSGWLVTSKLVNALVLPDGTTLVGSVRAERLEAAVGELHTS